MPESATLEAPETTVDPMAAFAAALTELDAKATEVVADIVEEQTEQTADADEDAGAADTGEQAEAEAEAKPLEGPTAEMRQVAKLAGLPDSFIAVAKDNAQLEQMIDALREMPAAAEADPEADKRDEPSADDLAWDLSGLPEEEFPSDDPVRKQLAVVQDKFSKLVAEHRRVTGALVKFATSQLDRDQQQTVQAMQKPFDAALDSFAHETLGVSTKKLVPSQAQVRTKIWNRAGLHEMPPDTAPEEIERLTLLAVEAVHKDIAEQRKQKQRLTQQQPKKVIGGAPGARSPEPPKTFEELLTDMAEGKLNVADI